MSSLVNLDKSIKFDEIDKILKKQNKTRTEMTASDWGKLIDKHPELFGRIEIDMTRIKTLITKANKELEGHGKPKPLVKKAQDFQKHSDWMKEQLKDGNWMRIKELRQGLTKKFELTDSKAENEYMKFVEVNVNFIHRENRKSEGWFIRWHDDEELLKQMQEDITEKNVPLEDHVIEPEDMEEDDFDKAWDDTFTKV